MLQYYIAEQECIEGLNRSPVYPVVLKRINTELSDFMAPTRTEQFGIASFFQNTSNEI